MSLSPWKKGHKCGRKRGEKMSRKFERDDILITVKGLKKHFTVGSSMVNRCILKAVDGLDFNIYRGETLGIVGESGCGKTTAGRTMIRLEEPTDGEVYFEGENIYKLSWTRMKKLRQKMQIIFQDPFSSLNPRMKVGDIVSEPLFIYGEGNKKERWERAAELLKVVDLEDYVLNRYPHQFSGGQRQRIGIARALALNPSFIVCDEPVSSLDVSIQAQVMNLLQDLQQEFRLTYLFISHDLSVIKHISDRIAVMYLGRLVELADSNKLFENPAHPYTRVLLSAIPDPFVEKKRIILEGDVPSPTEVPPGCPFHERCYMAEEICGSKVPFFNEIESDHYASCHFAKDIISECKSPIKQ